MGDRSDDHSTHKSAAAQPGAEGAGTASNDTGTRGADNGLDRRGSRQRRAFPIILVVGLVLIALVVGMPKWSQWRRNVETRREIQSIVHELQALSKQPLSHVKMRTFGGFPGPGGQYFGTASVEVSGWYRVVQKELILNQEIAFLRQRVTAITRLESLARSLPAHEGARILKRVSQFRDRWREIVPREITDDVGVYWNSMARDINLAIGVLANDLEP